MYHFSGLARSASRGILARDLIGVSCAGANLLWKRTSFSRSQVQDLRPSGKGSIAGLGAVAALPLLWFVMAPGGGAASAGDFHLEKKGPEAPAWRTVQPQPDGTSAIDSTTHISFILSSGKNLVSLLSEARISDGEAMRVADLINRATPLSELPPGTALSVVVGAEGEGGIRPVLSVSARLRLDLEVSIQRVGGDLQMTERSVQVASIPFRIQGTVGAGLYQAARSGGAPIEAAEAFVTAIGSRMDTGQIRASDKVDMIVDRRRDETGKVQFGKLLYAALSSGHERVQLMKWGDQGAWFDPSGKGATVGLLQRPVSGAITSSFGYRLHPLLGYTRMHKGADFRAAHGTPILAAADGQVTGAGWAGGYGQQVRISHARGMMTSYSHMSAITALPGQTVRQSQVIGYVGSTGMSTGPHLHYELHLNGTPVDPSSVRIETRHELRGRELELFRQRQRHLLANSARERAVQS